MADYNFIRRASKQTREQISALVDECNALYQADGEIYSAARPGGCGYWGLHIDYTDGQDAEMGLFKCDCGAILTDGDVENAECPNCWERWE